MIYLPTTRTLRAVTTTGADTTVSVNYVDHGTGTYVPGREDTEITTATTTVVCAAPGSGVVRQVMSVAAVNHDTSSQTVKLELYGSSARAITASVSLAPGESLIYEWGRGFDVLDRAGSARVSLASVSAAAGGLRLNYNYDRPTLATVRAPVASALVAAYMGRAAKDMTSVRVRAKCSGGIVILWSEVCVMVGDPVTAHGPNARIVGYADTATEAAGAAVFDKTITLTGPVRAGDHLWVGVATQAANQPSFEAVGVDSLSLGIAAFWSSTRPSTGLAAGRVYSSSGVDGVTSGAPVFSLMEA